GGFERILRRLAGLLQDRLGDLVGTVVASAHHEGEKRGEQGEEDDEDEQTDQAIHRTPWCSPAKGGDDTKFFRPRQGWALGRRGVPAHRLRVPGRNLSRSLAMFCDL